MNLRLRFIDMKKVIVIGCPGSGKSTFSKSLHKITNIPLFHLDMIFWNADKTNVEKPVFLDRLLKIFDKEDIFVIGRIEDKSILYEQLFDKINMVVL